MGRHVILIGSLLLNAALAASLLWPHRPSLSPPAPTPGVITNLITRTLLATSPAPTTNTTVAIAPFHWRELESEDYRVYAARLRAAGCPERALRNLLIAHIEDYFDRRQREENSPWPYWVTARERAALQDARERQAEARERSKQALYVELFGAEIYTARELRSWEVSSMINAMLGFLPEDKLDAVVNTGIKGAEAAQSARQKFKDIMLPEDEVRLGAMYNDLQTRLNAVLTPAEREEFELRLVAAEVVVGENLFSAMELTGHEMRELMRIRHEFRDLLKEEILGLRLNPAEQEARDTAMEERVRAFLGEARFVDYTLAKESDYREAFEFTRESHLPKSAAVQVYEVRRDAVEEAEKLQADKQLTPESRRAALAAIGAETERTLRATLGNSYDLYRKDHGGWLKQFNPPPPKGVAK